MRSSRGEKVPRVGNQKNEIYRGWNFFAAGPPSCAKLSPMNARILPLLLLLAGAPAFAQTSAPAPAYLAFASLDRDADQRLTVAEFLAAGAPAVAQRFAGIDTDHDGTVSPAELEVARAASEARVRKLAADDPARREYAAMPAFADMDQDHNGRVDPTEFAAAQEASLRQRFQVLDQDGDGVLSEHEYEAARRRFLQQVGRPPEPNAP